METQPPTEHTWTLHLLGMTIVGEKKKQEPKAPLPGPSINDEQI